MLMAVGLSMSVFESVLHRLADILANRPVKSRTLVLSMLVRMPLN